MAENDFNMTPVSSGNLDQVGFNPATSQGRALFKSGALYEYENCTQEEFDQIVVAPSSKVAFDPLWKYGGKPYNRIA